MDIEANRVLLPPERFQTGVLRRWQLFLFIVYNILVFAVVCFTFWCFNERLSQNEKYVAVLLEKLDAPYDHDSIGRSHPMDATHAVGRQVQNVNADVINVIEKARIKRNADGKKKRKAGKSNKRKKCKNCLPVVQIVGSGGSGNKDKTDLRNLWVTPNWVNQKQISKFYDVSSVQKAGKIQVKVAGLYMIYAQITLTGVTKRGFHVKKEPSKTTIASCANYSQVEGFKEEQANFIVRPCSLMTVLRLEKNDIVYIEEMEDNSNVLYTKVSAVFGLIKIGV